jgi:hypothetical protein
MHSNHSHNLTHEFHNEPTKKPKHYKIPINELPPRSTVLLEKLILLQLAKKISSI